MEKGKGNKNWGNGNSVSKASVLTLTLCFEPEKGHQNWLFLKSLTSVEKRSQVAYLLGAFLFKHHENSIPCIQMSTDSLLILKSSHWLLSKNRALSAAS